MSKPKTHRASGRKYAPKAGRTVPLCGVLDTTTRITEDPAKVTCHGCRNRGQAMNGVTPERLEEGRQR